jgi:hypothetical protein
VSLHAVVGPVAPVVVVDAHTVDTAGSGVQSGPAQEEA